MECVWTWARRLDLSAKAFSQTLQVNGFSPGMDKVVCYIDGHYFQVVKVLLTCVSPDVALQEPRPGEALSAVGALAALVVRAEVHGKGRHGDIGLVAVRAFSGFLVLQRSVRKQRGTTKDLVTLHWTSEVTQRIAYDLI